MTSWLSDSQFNDGTIVVPLPPSSSLDLTLRLSVSVEYDEAGDDNTKSCLSSHDDSRLTRDH
ncbi:hypothetical protein PanWU01x14_109490 [Parasponia andersonii]|uniref:Uncharacterized protein n=1 Tax=Parasponia andersonii TaxID=3476 RepID=A0A2P5CZU1_PARAD|nr:hypothetical protein PanWU01x14_109490 [Parasponia andersonii]